MSQTLSAYSAVAENQHCNFSIKDTFCQHENDKKEVSDKKFSDFIIKDLTKVQKLDIIVGQITNHGLFLWRNTQVVKRRPC